MSKNRALLLDRDGIVNVDHGYVGTIERFEFMPGLFPFLRVMRDKGYRLAIVTNQSGVARGKYTVEDYNRVTAHMLAELRREKIDINLTLACFEHPEGSAATYARESFWCKPQPGMTLEAIRRLDLDPAASIFLGDNLRDIQAAQAGGIGKCLWLTQEAVETPGGVIVVKSFDEAIQELKT